jgi:hypothetical protein
LCEGGGPFRPCGSAGGRCRKIPCVLTITDQVDLIIRKAERSFASEQFLVNLEIVIREHGGAVEAWGRRIGVDEKSS